MADQGARNSTEIITHNRSHARDLLAGKMERPPPNRTRETEIEIERDRQNK